MSYIVITWPEIQELMDKPGFSDNSYLINDDKGIDDFGSSAYFVDEDWLVEYGNSEEALEEMTEERYQYLNSLDLDEYDRETSEAEQRAFCEYQQKYHPDEIIYFQICSLD